MNALITTAWHITTKDLHASRELVIVGVMLAIAETLLRTVWPPLTMSLDPDRAELVNLLKNSLPPMRSLFAATLVAQLVHADPLAGAEGFWLTRPISRMTLFASKVGTMLLAIVLPAVLAQAAPMIAFGVPLLDVTRLIAEFLLYFAAGVMLIFAAAALTTNGRTMVAWIASLGILWAIVTIVMSNVPPPNRPATAASNPTRVFKLAPRRAGEVLTTFVLILPAAGAVVWHQYRTRRTGRSALIAATAAAIVIGVPQVIEPVRLEASPAPKDNAAVPLSPGVDFKEGARSVIMRPLGDQHGQCGVMVRVTQVQSSWPGNAPPLSYRFVHRPTRKNLIFTYFALPDRVRELGGGQRTGDIEARELFQILYRYAVVGPMITSDDPHQAEFKSVSCRDIDVVIRH